MPGVAAGDEVVADDEGVGERRWEGYHVVVSSWSEEDMAT